MYGLAGDGLYELTEGGLYGLVEDGLYGLVEGGLSGLQEIESLVGLHAGLAAVRKDRCSCC